VTNISAIGILYDVREENVAFLEFSRHFRRHGLPVPEIYAEDLSHGAYLEEDLGGTTLFEFLSQHREGPAISPEAVAAYRKVVALLPRFQVEAGRDLNYKVCYPRASFDRQSIAWDLNYFKYYFLRLAGIPFNEQGLEDDFSRSDEIPAERRPRLFSLSRFPVAQYHDAQNRGPTAGPSCGPSCERH
jgi:aminoglycoside/choline kinase family phosphotransferase